MITNLRKFLGLGMVAFSLTLLSMSPNKVASLKVVKYSIVHNGITLCLPAPAVEAHIREHNRTNGKFTCTKTGLCGEVPPPENVCGECAY